MARVIAFPAPPQDRAALRCAREAMAEALQLLEDARAGMPSEAADVFLWPCSALHAALIVVDEELGESPGRADPWPM